MDYWRSAALATLAVGLVACPNKDKDDDKIKPAPSATVPAAVSSTPAVDVPAKLTIVPRVKAELDGRADGITGTPAAVTGAVASLQTPTTWQTTKGDVTVSGTPDKKAQLAMTSFGAEGTAGKLAAAATALGLTACEWSPSETLTVGKNKLASS